MKSNPRGLNDLIKEHNVEESNQTETIEEIDITLIKTNPDQPRKYFDPEKIEELALSIKQHGLIQPIIVKKVSDSYVIIAGERRYQACLELNFKKIPAIIRQFQNKKIPEISLIENIQREDLNVIEEAKAYKNIIDQYDYKAHELALKVGKSRSHIVNILGLLKLPEDILKLVEDGRLSMGHARAISKLEDVKKMKDISEKIIKNELSVRAVELLLSSNKGENKKITKGIQEGSSFTKLNGLLYKTNIEGTVITIKANKIEVNKIIEVLKKF